MSKVIAVILSGGVGSRFGKSYPKQFSKVAGKTLIEHTLAVFNSNKSIDEVIVVSKREFINKVLGLVNKNEFMKVSRVISGGKERMDSTLSALKALEGEDLDTKLIIHDSVRPFITDRIIDDCVAKLDKYDAIDVVAPSADTIVEVNDDEIITNIPERKKMRRGQTPQAFRLGLLTKAYDIAMSKEDLLVTCDCGVVQQTMPDVEIAVVEGDSRNIKITEPLDIFLADKLFQVRGDDGISKMPIEEINSQLKAKVVVVFGASYGIGMGIADIAEEAGAIVYRLSRSLTQTDVSDIKSVKAAYENVFKLEGKIDYVVNSAAVLHKQSLNLTGYDDIDSSIDINLKGAIYVAKEAYPYLRKTNGGLLQFTSSSYTRGRAFYSLYSATKAAVVNLTQALSEEWVGSDVQINCICPERTATPMRTKNFGIEPEGTLLSAFDVAMTSISVLASGESGHIVDVKLGDVKGEKEETEKLSPVEA